MKPNDETRLKDLLEHFGIDYETHEGQDIPTTYFVRFYSGGHCCVFEFAGHGEFLGCSVADIFKEIEFSDDTTDEETEEA